MKTSTVILSAAACASLATAAAAQTAPGTVNGTLTMTGLVSNSCEVGPAQSPGSTFSTIVPLGELDQANGALRPDLHASTAASPSVSYQTQITCNTLTPKVELTASQLIDAAITTVPSGYANAVDYSADAVVTETSGSDTFSATTNGAVNGHTGPTTVTNPIANVPNNLTIKAYAFTTVGGLGNILLSSGGAPAYQGVITVNITPS